MNKLDAEARKLGKHLSSLARLARRQASWLAGWLTARG